MISGENKGEFQCKYFASLAIDRTGGKSHFPVELMPGELDLNQIFISLIYRAVTSLPPGQLEAMRVNSGRFMICK